MSSIRVTRKTARLLRVLLVVHVQREYAKSINGEFHMPSREMMEIARLGVGSFYPLTARLEACGWVKGEWEEVPEGENRPRRYFYHLTEPGVIAARQAVQEDSAHPPLWQRLTRKTR